MCIVPYLPRVEKCVRYSQVSQGSEEVIITVLREEVHGEAVDSREGETVEPSEVKGPISTKNTVSYYLRFCIKIGYLLH